MNESLKEFAERCGLCIVDGKLVEIGEHQSKGFAELIHKEIWKEHFGVEE